MYVGYKRKGDNMDLLLFILLFISLDIIIRVEVDEFRKDKREREEIQERTDLEIEGMKRQIVANCNERLIYTESCKKCKISNTCKRCYKAPRIENCNDWETDDVLAAYELLKEDK